jgi:hypothetical protein
MCVHAYLHANTCTSRAILAMNLLKRSLMHALRLQMSSDVMHLATTGSPQLSRHFGKCGSLSSHTQHAFVDTKFVGSVCTTAGRLRLAGYWFKYNKASYNHVLGTWLAYTMHTIISLVEQCRPAPVTVIVWAFVSIIARYTEMGLGGSWNGTSRDWDSVLIMLTLYLFIQSKSSRLIWQLTENGPNCG